VFPFLLGIKGMDAIDRAIDKSHFKSLQKVAPHVKAMVPSATDEEIKRVHKLRPTDELPYHIENYMSPIFSTHPHSFQIDLLQNSTTAPPEYPKFFLVAININTKFGYATPTSSKRKGEVLNAIKKFVTDCRVSSIVCDEESAFVSEEVVDFLTEKKISLKIINNQRHSALGVIDRFIRTLRDMNGRPTVTGKRTSDDPRYRDFTDKRMQKLLKIYNDTVHRTTKHKPIDMENKRSLEISYIIERLYDRERRAKVTDAELKEGQFVRYILPRKVLGKNRFKVSPEYYKISHRDGRAYVIMAKDGTVLTVARWRLFPVSDVSRLRMGKSFNNRYGTVISINGEEKGTHGRPSRYEVTFEGPDGERYEDVIPKINLRGSNPQVKSELELKWEKP
jgi:hypothetical protein